MIRLLFILTLGLSLTAMSVYEKSYVNGHYESSDCSADWKISCSHFFLSNGNFKFNSVTDVGKSKGSGTYSINSTDSTITFKFDSYKEKSHGLNYISRKHDDYVFKFSTSPAFSFGTFKKSSKK